MWQQDPVMLPFSKASLTGRAMGYAGEPDKKAAEVWNKYIITDMYAQVANGKMSAEDSVQWAAGELRKVYGGSPRAAAARWRQPRGASRARHSPPSTSPFRAGRGCSRTSASSRRRCSRRAW